MNFPYNSGINQLYLDEYPISHFAAQNRKEFLVQIIEKFENVIVQYLHLIILTKTQLSRQIKSSAKSSLLLLCKDLEPRRTLPRILLRNTLRY